MPFGLKFKRTRRYDISTKNIFMVEVQMLDNSFLECTLTADSTGNECLDGIAQKIELQETQYFGLRYVTKKLQFRWVDLGKPLKKQLEKYAQSSHSSRSPRLYFGVMFYIANAHKVVDDVARYQYYLQLKNDIVDGRLPLTVEQVIRLAAYSLQVEFSDHEYDRNAADYFTDNMVFPKNLTKDENILSELMNEVLQAYMTLQGVHPVKAEILYMKEIQMMDGYGMEYYVAKDEKGKELYLGTSYIGIFARYLDGQPPIFFKWTEVARLSQSKKTFEIDTSKSSVQYTMEDSDTSKYLRRMCLLQQKFYKSNKSTLSTSLTDVSEYPETDIPDIQQSVLPQTDIPAHLTESQTSLTFQDQKYEQDSQSTSVNTDDYYRQSQQSLNTSAQDLGPAPQQSDSHVDGVGAQHMMQQQQHQQQPTVTTPDPTNDPNYASRLAALPAYRQTPDYETAVMRQRMSQGLNPAQQQVHHTQQHIHEGNQNLAHSQIYAQSEEGLAYSQPDIGHGMTGYGQDGHYSMAAQMGNYAQTEKGLAYSQPDIGHSPANFTPDSHYNLGPQIRGYGQSVYTGVFQDQSEYLQYRVGDRATNLVMQPTYSSPELTSQGLPQGYTQDNFLSVNEAFAYHYKPPPPYPRASNSTPDLAVQTMKPNVSDSPDLISRKTLGDSAFTKQSKVDESVESLTEVLPRPDQLVTGEQQTPVVSVNVSECVTEPDDASSDHSNSTFHVKELDSEPEDAFIRAIPQRQSSKSKIQIRFVAPNKAPPPSTSKDVAVRRESFRRMMIARSGSFTPGVLRDESKRWDSQNRSLRDKQRERIEENVPETQRSKPSAAKNLNSVLDIVPPAPTVTRSASLNSPPTAGIANLDVGSPQPVAGSSNVNTAQVEAGRKKISVSSSVDELQHGIVGTSAGREVCRSQSDANKGNSKMVVLHEKAVSLDSSSERQQLLDKLKSTEPEVPSTISETVTEDRATTPDSDSDSQKSDSDQQPMGPLKLAAMNGLAMSRPMVLALMNDETRAPKDERRRILENKLSENLVFKEFEETLKKMPEMECNVAKLPENSTRNRFRDVLPYDGTRVKLNPRKDNPSGYLNGSHIKLSVGNRVWWYIATQAPLDTTVADFWQMIWEQEVEVVGMLTALVELGRPKCYPYWPQDPGTDNRQVFGDYEVTLLFTNDSLCYITNRIQLVHLPSKKERQIWHLQYTDWPDHGCPDDMYGFLGFLDEVESVQRLAESEEGSGKKSPIVIHCSAGVGRSGVVILTQVMKWCLEHNHDVDLPKALSMIRQQRMYMVQTLGQYNFIHKTLIQYLKNTRLI